MVESLSFSFTNVRRHYVDPLSLGKKLAGKRIDLPRNSIVGVRAPLPSIGDSLHVIDSIVTSSDFSISIDRTSQHEFQCQCSGSFRGTLASAGSTLRVNTVSGLDLTFSGDKELPFALSCFRLSTDASGRDCFALPVSPSEARASTIRRGSAS